jgi:hypothetical protein
MMDDIKTLTGRFDVQAIARTLTSARSGECDVELNILNCNLMASLAAFAHLTF